MVRLFVLLSALAIRLSSSIKVRLAERIAADLKQHLANGAGIDLHARLGGELSANATVGIFNRPHPWTNVIRSTGTEMGQGSFGTVFLTDVKCNNDASQVVVKQIVPKKKSATTYTTLTEEIEMQKSVSDQNVVALYDHWPKHSSRFTGQLSIMMEPCMGGELGKLWKKQLTVYRPTIEKKKHLFAKFAVDIAKGIRAVHKSHLIHRDIKPENIFVAIYGSNVNCFDFPHLCVAKVGDFGLSCKTEAYAAGPPCDGGLSGTPAFLPPELLKENKLRKAMDWWAMGLSLYDMWHGKVPYKSYSLEGLLSEISTLNSKWTKKLFFASDIRRRWRD